MQSGVLIMFGFVNSNKEERKLGGDIHQRKQKIQKIFWSITGIVMLILLNVLFYYLTKV